jgi:hypothetical protein
VIGTQGFGSCLLQMAVMTTLIKVIIHDACRLDAGDAFQLRKLSMNIEAIRKVVDLGLNVDTVAHGTLLFQVCIYHKE